MTMSVHMLVELTILEGQQTMHIEMLSSLG